MNKFHLLYWVFEYLEDHTIQQLCGISEKTSENAKMTVGELFQERLKAYEKAKAGK